MCMHIYIYIYLYLRAGMHIHIYILIFVPNDIRHTMTEVPRSCTSIDLPASTKPTTWPKPVRPWGLKAEAHVSSAWFEVCLISASRYSLFLQQYRYLCIHVYIYIYNVQYVFKYIHICMCVIYI